ncbi:MAG: LPS export ABC transporter periplasmic protein LptC [Deltaproteobacteria bacterium]|nr:LPS export ABC transporter periplasmic protein LptC [Deltaproteobacteria bacterium]
MKATAKINSKTIRIILISVIIVTVSLIIGYYIGKRHTFSGPEEFISSIKNDASISIDTVHQETTRDGKKEWSLDASSVQYLIQKKRAIFNDLSAIYFLKGNKKIYLTANKGILNTESNDIEILGNVVVKNDDYKLNTEILFYDHEKRKIFSRAPVKIFDGSSTLMAKSMSIDLNTNNLTFSGVRGEFIGDMSL